MLYLCMLPIKSPQTEHTDVRVAAFGLASVVLFALGCWKIDVSRQELDGDVELLDRWG